MKRLFTFNAFVAVLICFSCEIEDPFLKGAPDDPEELKEYNKFKITIDQGVSGTLLFSEGSCAPAVDTQSCKTYPVARKIRLYEFTTKEDTEPADGAFFSKVNTKLVATSQSDKEGFYQVALPPGSYSMFVEEANLLYANRTRDDGGILVSVVDSGWVTIMHPEITYKAFY